MRAPQTDWTAERIATLRRTWARGDSAREIAFLLGCSYNAVTGKVRRLGLPARPNPVPRG